MRRWIIAGRTRRPLGRRPADHVRVPRSGAGQHRGHRRHPRPLETTSWTQHPSSPAFSREEVVQKALESAGRVLGGKDTSTLETRATVGLYTWKDEEGNWVEGRKAWLVVVDDLPITFPSGPYTSPENRVDRSGQRQQNQLVIFFGADTGEEIEGSIAGRWG